MHDLPDMTYWVCGWAEQRVCGIHSPSPRHFSCNFFKRNAIHVCFCSFSSWEKYIYKSFPIMGHLCCITVWLIDLYTPRKDQASNTDATPLSWNQELSSSFGSSGMKWSSFLDSSGAAWDCSWSVVCGGWRPGGLKPHHEATGGWRAVNALRVNRYLGEWKAKMTRPLESNNDKGSKFQWW